jgi:serine/threonine protein kinase
VALLALVQHPSVPRLLAQGFYKHPSGTTHPFLVMQWVQGPSLYDWARQHSATSRQVLRALSQLARALHATHSASALHRDVKGDNVLVRRSDSRAMLMDFGAGHYQAAARVTWQPLPMGTPAYRSPEAGLFFIRSVRTPEAHYPAQPADDVFALGVTAYRLVTGQYPPAAEPLLDEAGSWYMEDARVQPPRELSPRLEPRLSALILRMLSLSPAARGTADELADSLDASANSAGPEADLPLFHSAPEPHQVPSPLHSERLRARGPNKWVPRLALALAAVSLLLGVWRAVSARLEHLHTSPPVASRAARPDAGTTDLGDTASVSPLASVQPPTQQPIAQDLPPKPLPGQIRPDAKGQCPEPEQMAFNGGCWVEHLPTNVETCEQNGYVFMQDRCYAPALLPRRKPQPTSNPQEPR